MNTSAQLITAFNQYWSNSSTLQNGDFHQYIGNWSQFHLQKASLFFLLFVLLTWLSLFLWKRFVKTTVALSSKGKFLSVLEIFTSLGAFLSWIIVMANVQGFLYPLSSLMTRILPAADSKTTTILKTMKNQINSGNMNRKTEYFLQDFAKYHLVIAILGIITILVLLYIIIRIWKSLRSQSLSTLQQIVIITMITIFALLLLTTAVITIANYGTYFKPNNAFIHALSGDF